MAHSPTVLIIGCGIAGPVLACLLQRKGYYPIVFEKVSKLGDAGASLMLMPNGLKVLDAAEALESVIANTKPLTAFHDTTASGVTLGMSDLPASFPELYGHYATGVRRSTVNLQLKERLVTAGIEIREGWELVNIDEDEGGVCAHFSNGQTAKGSFLVGCDGLKSNTRRFVLSSHGANEKPANYTGLTQTAGISRAPEKLLGASALRNWYGDGLHFICYPVSATHISWALTRREGRETEETWRPCRPEEALVQVEGLRSILSGWDDAVVNLVCTAEKIVKYGLFDRDELTAEHWYTRRCVLVGDAAHPTSPHLGQGANQALEDCYHLSKGLPTLNDTDGSAAHSSSAFAPNLVDAVFRAFAETRQPRTSLLVKGARAQGNRRVVEGFESGRNRDAKIKLDFADTDALATKWSSILEEPYNAHNGNLIQSDTKLCSS